MRTVFRNEEIPGRISNLQPFLSVGALPDGSRRWWATCGPAPDMGHLPRKYHDSARTAVYTVISYGTPIAWVWEREVGTEPYFYVLPDVSYSPTTGQQQYEIRAAWSTALRRQGTYPALGHGRAGRNGREVVRVPGNAEVYGRTRRVRAGGLDGVRPGEMVGRTYELGPDSVDYDGFGQGLPVGDARHRSHP